MHIVTDYLLPNEPCYGAMAGPVLMLGPNGSEQFRWVERIFVVRGDAIAKWERNLGPAEDFKGVIQTRDLLDGDVTVAEVQEQLAIDRADTYWARQQAALRAQSTLIKDTMDQLEERRAIINNRTVSGPKSTKQRNGFSKQTINRAISQRHQDITGIIPRRQR